MGLRSELCDGHYKTLTLLSLRHFATTLEVCLGSLSIWKTHLRPRFNFLPVLRLASLPIFPPNIMMVIMPKQFYFRFIRPEDISPKSTIFVPMCSCKVWHFYGGFGAVASSLLSGLTGYVYIGLVLLWI